jgi:DNA topoisomerase-3
VPVKPDEKVATEKIDVVPLVTRAPPRLNEATLLSAMEGAGKLIEDDDLREAMREKGLGTPATRAAIIEGLIAERYVHREGKDLTPTAKASADDAAAWPWRAWSSSAGADGGVGIQARADGARKASARYSTRDRRDDRAHVGQAKGYESDTIPGDFATLSNRCPSGLAKCTRNTRSSVQNPNCDFALKILGGRQIEPQEADALIMTERLLEGFRNWAGRSRRS